MLAETLEPEAICDPIDRGLPDQNAAGRLLPFERQFVVGFEPRRGVHRITDRRVLHALVGADVTHHSRPREDADPQARGRLPVALPRHVECFQRFSHGEGALHRLRGVARYLFLGVARDGDAEAGHEPVAQEVVDETPVNLDEVRHSVGVRPQPLHHLGRVAPLGTRRIPEQVRDQHSHRDALGLRPAPFHEKLALLPHRVDEAARHVFSEEVHRLGALGALALGDVGDDQRQGTETPQRRGHHRQPERTHQRSVGNARENSQPQADRRD